MKKIKYLIAAILAIVLCLSFTGCAKNGSVVQNSLEYSCRYYSSLEQISANYSFKVTIPAAKKYSVDYNVAVYEDSRRISSKQVSKTVSPNGKDSVTVSEYWNIPYSGAAVSEIELKVVVTDVRITPQKSDDSYVGYAVGFGVAGAALLVTATVLFVLTQRKKRI